MWLGHTGTLLRETGGSSAWFSAFEAVSRGFVARRRAKGETGKDGGEVTKADLGVIELMFSGACAGM